MRQLEEGAPIFIFATMATKVLGRRQFRPPIAERFLIQDNRQDPYGHTAGIQDLAFGNSVLYAMTGYNIFNGFQPRVYEFRFDPNTDSWECENQTTPINISSPASPSSDAFTVLPDGNLLINDFDGGDGCTVYREYYGVNPPSGYNLGDPVPESLGGLVIDLSQQKYISVGYGFLTAC